MSTKLQGNTTPATSRSKNWTLTLWNTDALDILKNSNPLYLVYGPEKCPTTGKEHYQCFVHYRLQKYQTAMRKLYTGHDVQIARGTAEQNRRYIVGPYHKDGKEKPFNPDAVEIGQIPEQGKRNDINEFIKAIKQGRREDDLDDDFGLLRAKYARFEEKKINECAKKKAKIMFKENIVPEVHVRWGPPRTGKTRFVYEKHGVDNVFRLTGGDGSKGSIWWSSYDGQEVILLDEFRGQMNWDYLLQLTDRYPMELQTKGGSTWRCCKYIYICSNISPDKWYANDLYEALSKRFTSITEVN